MINRSLCQGARSQRVPIADYIGIPTNLIRAYCALGIPRGATCRGFVASGLQRTADIAQEPVDFRF